MAESVSFNPAVSGSGASTSGGALATGNSDKSVVLGEQIDDLAARREEITNKQVLNGASGANGSSNADVIKAALLQNLDNEEISAIDSRIKDLKIKRDAAKTEEAEQAEEDKRLQAKKVMENETKQQTPPPQKVQNNSKGDK